MKRPDAQHYTRFTFALLLLTGLFVFSTAPANAKHFFNGKIAFASNRDGDSEIFTMNADGTNQLQLTNNVSADNTPAWSPDGKKIAFLSNRDGNGEIYVMNADGSNQTRLTNNFVSDSSP